MKLLDKFRSQPEWRSEDPAVRATAVRDLSNVDGEQELLNEIAHHDDDPSVRLEAVLRLEDVDALASIARDDGDTTVRSEAEEMLRDLAIEAEDLSSIELGLGAVSNERDLVAVARSARLESVSRVALAKLKDPRALGLVARRATRGEIAKEALSRLDDPAEILAVALNSEDKAITVGAFERLTAGHLTRDTLEQLSKRAKQKAVQRRAKAALAALDQALPDPAADLAHFAVCDALEAMTGETSLEHGREKLDRLLTEWSALDTIADTSIVKRFATAREQAEVRLAELESAQTADRRVQEDGNRAIANRDAICRRVELLSGIVPSDTVQQLREEWAALAGDTTSHGASIADQLSALDRRFERALGAVEERPRQLREFQSRLIEVERVIAEMEALAKTSDASSAERWLELDGALERQLGQKADKPWQWLVSPGAGSDQADAVDGLRRRHNVVRDTRQALSAEARVDQDRLEQENLAQILQRSRTVEGLVSSDKLRLVEAERQLRGIRRLIDDPGPIPRRDQESVTRKLRRAHTGLLGRVRELRDFADWQRWANLGIQEALCRRMEELAKTPDSNGDDGDDARLASRFQEIMAKWRQASDVPKNRGAEPWERFKTAHDTIHPRCQKFFDAQDSRREQNLERQRAIVEESERLAASTDWLKSLRRITDLQAEWKDLKPVPRKEQKELWTRFREACNTFFGRRKADLAERKKAWSKNLALKEALCDRVIALAEAEDLDAAVGEAKKAQAEWKGIGPVRRNRSEVVWQRFRTACDAVFDRVQAKQDADSHTRAAVREALCVEAESLMSEETAGVPPEDLAARIRDLQQRWREAPEVPQPFSRQLTARFGQAIARLVETYPDAFRGTDLDPARKLKRLEKLCERVEALQPTGALGQEGASPAEILATKWRDALASNLMGARVDEAAERRSALEEVKRARADCRRLGNSPTGDTGRQLLTRFHSACDRVQSWASPGAPQRSRRDSTIGRESALASGH